MPRVAMNYQNTIIYKIVCKDISITDCYVGSTTNFTKRKYAHQHACNNEKDKAYNYNVYSFIRANCGWENWDMIEIEKFPCNDKNEALKQERYWIETLKSTLNKVIPSRTSKEYKNDNKEEISKKNKQYREYNKSLIAEKQKVRYINNKETILEYQKQYYQTNANMVLEKNKQYREANPDKLKEYEKKRAEKKKEYMKQFREANADKLKAQMKKYKETKKQEKTQSAEI